MRKAVHINEVYKKTICLYRKQLKKQIFSSATFSLLNYAII